MDIHKTIKMAQMSKIRLSTKQKPTLTGILNNTIILVLNKQRKCVINK